MRKFLFSALQHFRWSVTAFVSLGITQTLIGLLSIVYLQKLLDAIPTVRAVSELGGVFLTYALLCAANYGLSYLEEYPNRILDYGLYQWAKVVAIKKIARIDYLAYQNLGTGKLIQVIEHGADATKKILFDFSLRLFRRKTVIIIAHRLQTIRNVNRILVIEVGRILQDGSFEQLVNVPGRFKELWDTQTQNRERSDRCSYRDVSDVSLDCIEFGPII